VFTSTPFNDPLSTYRHKLGGFLVIGSPSGWAMPSKVDLLGNKERMRREPPEADPGGFAEMLKKIAL
jgi:hypothetical protein